MNKDSKPKDIKNVVINTALPVNERIKGFIEQVGDPYVFRAGETVIEVRFGGERSFSAVISTLLGG